MLNEIYELKPCPFCGVEMVITASQYLFGQPKQTHYRIEGNHLRNCPLSLYDSKPPASLDLDWLVKCWNTRAESEVDTQE